MAHVSKQKIQTFVVIPQSLWTPRRKSMFYNNKSFQVRKRLETLEKSLCLCSMWFACPFYSDCNLQYHAYLYIIPQSCRLRGTTRRRSLFSVSGPVSRMSFIWRESFALQTENFFCFLIFQLCVIKIYR